jgi:hypothetical protein
MNHFGGNWTERKIEMIVMYHFMMATNNTAALRIANDIVKPKFKL